MPLPSNDKQVGDIGHADDHNAIVNEIISTASAIGQRLLASTASTLYLGINNTANHSISASSINWSQIISRPSASPTLNPQIGVSLTGPVTGNASAVFNNLSNAQVTITTQQNITINPQTVSSYTLQLSDVSKLITMNNASENAVVIPLESSVNFPIGSKIDIVQIGSGTSSVTFVNGVTLNSDTSKKTINARYAAASLVKLESDSWLLIGGLK